MQACDDLSAEHEQQQEKLGCGFPPTTPGTGALVGGLSQMRDLLAALLIPQQDGAPWPVSEELERGSADLVALREEQLLTSAQGPARDLAPRERWHARDLARRGARMALEASRKGGRARRANVGEKEQESAGVALVGDFLVLEAISLQEFLLFDTDCRPSQEASSLICRSLQELFDTDCRKAALAVVGKLGIRRESGGVVGVPRGRRVLPTADVLWQNLFLADTTCFTPSLVQNNGTRGRNGGVTGRNFSTFSNLAALDRELWWPVRNTASIYATLQLGVESCDEDFLVRLEHAAPSLLAADYFVLGFVVWLQGTEVLPIEAEIVNRCHGFAAAAGDEQPGATFPHSILVRAREQMPHVTEEKYFSETLFAGDPPGSVWNTALSDDLARIGVYGIPPTNYPLVLKYLLTAGDGFLSFVDALQGRRRRRVVSVAEEVVVTTRTKAAGVSGGKKTSSSRVVEGAAASTSAEAYARPAPDEQEQDHARPRQHAAAGTPPAATGHEESSERPTSAARRRSPAATSPAPAAGPRTSTMGGAGTTTRSPRPFPPPTTRISSSVAVQPPPRLVGASSRRQGPTQRDQRTRAGDRTSRSPRLAGDHDQRRLADDIRGLRALGLGLGAGPGPLGRMGFALVERRDETQQQPESEPSVFAGGSSSTSSTVGSSAATAFATANETLPFGEEENTNTKTQRAFDRSGGTTTMRELDRSLDFSSRSSAGDDDLSMYNTVMEPGAGAASPSSSGSGTTRRAGEAVRDDPELDGRVRVRDDPELDGRAGPGRPGAGREDRGGRREERGGRGGRHDSERGGGPERRRDEELREERQRRRDEERRRRRDEEQHSHGYTIFNTVREDREEEGLDLT